MRTKITDWFQSNYPELFDLMKSTTHTHSNGRPNPFHLEGSVLAHTNMVLDLLEDSNDIDFLFAGLFHDLGKIYTRKEKENGRVSFSKHENVSMFKSIDILNKAKKEGFNIDILRVLKLINWHGSFWVRADEELKDRLSDIDLKYGNDLNIYYSLLSFTKADAFGRTMQSSSEKERLSDFFVLLNNYTPYNHLKYPKHKPDKEVVFLIGPSGSGKSTYLKNNNDRFKDYSIISIDSFFDEKKLDYNSIDYSKNIDKAWKKVLNDISKNVDSNKNIVIDMTNLSVIDRFKLLKRFPTTKYNHSAFVFLKGENFIREKNKFREGKKIPTSVINKQIENFEIPTFKEFSSIEYIF